MIMTPIDQRLDKLETSLRETIDEMQTDIHELKRQIDGLKALTTFLAKRVMSLEAGQQVQSAEQTAQAVSESLAWQDSADAPAA
jgi:phage shock protein A